MPRLLLAVTLLLSILLTLGCTSLVTSGVGSGYSPDDGRTAAQRRSDAAITNHINNALVADRSIPAMDVHVSTYRGRVTLSGRVPGASVASRAVAIARSTPGVKSVANRLRY